MPRVTAEMSGYTRWIRWWWRNTCCLALKHTCFSILKLKYTPPFNVKKSENLVATKKAGLCLTITFGTPYLPMRTHPFGPCHVIDKSIKSRGWGLVQLAIKLRLLTLNGTMQETWRGAYFLERVKSIPHYMLITHNLATCFCVIFLPDSGHLYLMDTFPLKVDIMTQVTPLGQFRMHTTNVLNLGLIRNDKVLAFKSLNICFWLSLLPGNLSPQSLAQCT